MGALPICRSFQGGCRNAVGAMQVVEKLHEID